MNLLNAIKTLINYLEENDMDFLEVMEDEGIMDLLIELDAALDDDFLEIAERTNFDEISIQQLKALANNFEKFLNQGDVEFECTPLFYNGQNNEFLTLPSSDVGDAIDFFEVYLNEEEAEDFVGCVEESEVLEFLEEYKENPDDEDEDSRDEFELYIGVPRPCHHNLLSEMTDYGQSYDSSLKWRLLFRLFGFEDIFPQNYDFEQEILELSGSSYGDVEIYFDKSYMYELADFGVEIR